MQNLEGRWGSRASWSQTVCCLKVSSADSRPCPLSSLLSEQQLASALPLLPDVQAGTDVVGSDGDRSASQVVPTGYSHLRTGW